MAVSILRCSMPCRSLLAAALTAGAADGYRLGPDMPIYSVSAKELDLAQEVTLEAWVKAEPMDAGGGRILDKSHPGTQLGYMLDTQPGNSLRFLNQNGDVSVCGEPSRRPLDARRRRVQRVKPRDAVVRRRP